MRLLRRQRRIDVVAVAREDGARLGVGDGAVEPCHEGDDGAGGERRGGVGREAVVLDDPEGGAVAVGAGGGRLGVDLAVGPAVEVDDGEPRVRRVDAVADHVVEVGGPRGLGERAGGGHDEGFGEEGVVLVVAFRGLLQGLAVGERGEGLDPRHGRGAGGGGGGQGAQKFGLDLGVEVGEGAEVGAADAEAVAVHVHAHAEFAVDDRGVLGKGLDVEEGVGGRGCGFEHVGDAEGPIDDRGRSGNGLQVECCHDPKGVRCAS